MFSHRGKGQKNNSLEIEAVMKDISGLKFGRLTWSIERAMTQQPRRAQ